MLKLITFTMLSLLLTGQSAWGQFWFEEPAPPPQQGKQRLQLHYHGQQFRGQNTLKLKQAIKQQYPALALQGKQLKRVILVAKSKKGRAKAALTVGQDQTYKQIIDGNPYDFQYKGNFNRLTFENPSLDSKGKWQLQLKGNIKVKKVVVVIKGKTKKVTLDFYGQHLKGQNTLKLKQQLKQQFPGFKLQNKQLKSVKLFAKSKKGGAQATLAIGQSDSWPETIPGNPQQFRKDAPWTFTAIPFANPSHNSKGKWQIKLRGNVKIQKVVLKFK